jgi:uncharacterized alpha-E superfamily protein
MNGRTRANSRLLSRIAEALFWTGRYVERADDTARMVDVYVHQMLESSQDEDLGCRALLGVLGIPAPAEPKLDIGTTVYLLAYDQRNPAAIAGSMLAARSGAGGIREIVSSEVWECLNVTSLELTSKRRAAERLGPHIYLRFIRERAALFFGLVDSTMSHDDAWRFLVLGRSLERIDMTARLLLTPIPENAPAGSVPPALGSPMVLRACGAYESFIRTRSWTTGSRQAAEFLVLDRLFPRSVLHTLATAEQCLAALDPGPVNAGADDTARRPIARLAAMLEYADPQLLPGQLADLVGTFQQVCLDVTQAMTERYFGYGQPVSWARGA